MSAAQSTIRVWFSPDSCRLDFKVNEIIGMILRKGVFVSKTSDLHPMDDDNWKGNNIIDEYELEILDVG